MPKTTTRCPTCGHRVDPKRLAGPKAPPAARESAKREPGKREAAARARVEALRAALDRLGTQGAVAEEVGITGERVRQLLAKGVRRGWIAPFSLDAVHLEWEVRRCGGRERIRRIIAESGGVWTEIAEALGLNPSVSPKSVVWFAAAGFAEDVARVRDERAAGRQDEILAAYRSHERALGYSPTSTWIFRNDPSLYTSITRLGGFPKFCADHGITPRYSERQTYLADTIEARAAGESTKRKLSSEEILARYREIERRLGYAPTAMWLERNDKALSHAMRYEGGFVAWCERHGVQPRYKSENWRAAVRATQKNHR